MAPGTRTFSAMPQMPHRSYSTRLARSLRRRLTPEEARLWIVLRHDFAHKFRRQEPLGGYIVDFVCYERRLIVEVDGVQHADEPGDERRDAYLRGLGFRVLRIWNGDVLYRLSEVTDWIEAALDLAVPAKRAAWHRRDPGPGG